ncbi:MAG TPA: transposase [Ktedonobacteraceae bacterium]|nr:transposase [Ktedonobacteraceae bacterium]
MLDSSLVSCYYMNMIATRTIRIQLNPTPEQAALLQQTMQEYTAAFNAVCHLADTQQVSNGVELHRLTYAEQRAATDLPSQLICAARVKATEAVKSVFARRQKQIKKYEALQKQGKATRPLRLASTPHSDQCAIRYDARSFRFDRQIRMVSLVHVQQAGHTRNRALIAVKVPAYYEQYLTAQWQQESADLLSRKGTFWLHMVVSCAQSAILPTAENKTVGIDLGINRLAVTSQPRFFGSKHIKETNNRSFRLRRKLQAKGTKSAKRHLQKVAGRLKRFQADSNHVVAKQIVSSLSPGDTIAMENLTDIRERVKGRRAQRRAMSNWSFAQLQGFLAYKAAYKSIAVEFVDARYSSQACSRCGHREKRNRVCQSEFSCRKCGYRNNADENAAYNLASRATCVAGGQPVKLPIVSDRPGLGTSPRL